MGPINNIPTLVQIVAWHQMGNKLLSEPVMVYVTNEYMRYLASINQTHCLINPMNNPDFARWFQPFYNKKKTNTHNEYR